MDSADTMGEVLWRALERIDAVPRPLLATLLLGSIVGFVAMIYFALFLIAPVPREPFRSEKSFRTILPNGDTSDPAPLPCWLDRWRAQHALATKKRSGASGKKAAPVEDTPIEAAEVFMTVVVPAFNEEQRLPGMLEEAVDFLVREYGDAHGAAVEARAPSTAATAKKEKAIANGAAAGGGSAATTSTAAPSGAAEPANTGWEILVVSDGSTDGTVSAALSFARSHQLSAYPIAVPGPWKGRGGSGKHIPHGSIRVVELAQNRGKGGAVTHGMRHARGKYVVFADADGASRFDDLGKLVDSCKEVEDAKGKGVAVGSRAHLVGSEAVVKRSKLRNFLMHGFHFLLWLLTPPATARIRDTQCGFKLFSRASLPDVVPYMHSEGWIFDVEMLMLAESAGIRVAEVPIGWKEVQGSKLNVLKDSIAMFWGLAVLRVAWGTGVYKRS
ncbi:dolichyl-phosphate beta-glucosyltransferase [Lineolata rhizophorae]|uniref:dolichyl-phosphate beta-glucosyltransferase n=1 Tax=Lineolata rhizophorae TaxID=578093 RepID=A0A6A6NXJ6_9PEZI|nr:dolichyl-phosphate beta-glucosyltransferase [Lineolata rhizophorae]